MRAEDAAITVAADAPITFAARGQKLPVPLVPVRLNGHDSLLLLDTGSSHQALTRDFSEANGLAGEPAASGRDHAGETVATARAAAFSVQLGEFRRQIDDAIVVAGPPPFKPLGIAGFLSPQHFFGADAHVVLDFPAGRLLALHGNANGIREWTEQHYPHTEILALPRVAGPNPRKLYVQAQLPSGATATAEIDTGGTTTEFADNLLPPGNTNATTTSVAVSGTKRTARVVENQTLALGGANFGPMKVKARPAGVAPEILLGIDLLRNVVLILPASADAPLLLIRPRR